VALAGDQISNVFVSNRDNSMSLLKCNSAKDGIDIRCREAQNIDVGFATSWPANQYDGNKHWWWTGLGGEVVGLKARRSVAPLRGPKNVVTVETYNLPGAPAGRNLNGSNFIGVTPDGKAAWNSAREIDEIQEIDTDPKSPTFGTILTRIDVPISADAGPAGQRNGRMRPCDMSITPDGNYLWEPDLGGETITGVDIQARSVVAQLTLLPLDPTERVRPFMLTTNGEVALVENFEAPFGTYSVIDVSDPANPVEIKRITQVDGLGVSPQTSEFTPDGQFAYLITNGSPSVPGTVDVLDLDTLEIVNKIALPDGCRPHTGDFSNDGQFFFLNCSGSNEVAVISNALQEVVQQVALSGDTPRGVITR
jgi:DNA-binding beta-propeller fold protein YncE